MDADALGKDLPLPEARELGEQHVRESGHVVTLRADSYVHIYPSQVDGQ